MHYGANTARFVPWDFEMRSAVLERYGRGAIPEDSTIQDWGLTYDELEPYYDLYERMAGVAGPDDMPFQGRRSRPYPLPPNKQGLSAELFADACRQLGHHPFPDATVGPLAGVHQPRWGDAGGLHLLRGLHPLCLRG